ncbi:DUF6508 domain-containing protein [Alteribacter aurantiacus]|uniref:DUF6508 domain-containing protein n=1 Tax=Alteribacter aurantiacus TaxID=254410 RepID=UPI00041A57E1|nr:DUF6508 domain-containing protein [Alteribacter aurantiacus]
MTLSKYISYFKNMEGGAKGERDLSAFLEDAYESGCMIHHYNELITKEITIENIKTAEEMEARAMLTYCIRSDRFVEGSACEYAENGTFLALLVRLKEHEGDGE